MIGRKIHPEREIDRDQREESRYSCIGEDNAQHTASQPEEEAFGDELAKKSAARCAKSRAHGNFSYARRSFDEEKIANVGASNDEEKADCDKEGDDRLAVRTRDKFTDRNRMS